MKEFHHVSVLLQECIDGLNIKPDGIYVDGTLGGAGHSSQIAARLTTGRLIGIDRDPIALEAAGKRLEPYRDRVTLVHSNFCEIAKVLDGKVVIDPALCNHCGRCLGKCPFGAIEDYVDGYKVTIGGRWGKKTGIGRPLSKIFTSEKEVLEIIEKVLELYESEGVKGERFAETIERLGFDYVENKIICG